MATFEEAIPYVLANEGGDSRHPADRGGFTRWGITEKVARENGYDINALTPAQAHQIYREQYWFFGAIRDQRVATKLLDICVNVGRVGVARLAQRASGAEDDGVWGPETERAINGLNPESALEALSMAVADYYCDIVRKRPSQVAFLKGWMRRAIRRPR